MTGLDPKVMRAEIRRRLLAIEGELPISALSRMARSANGAASGGRFLLAKSLHEKLGSGGPDPEAVSKMVASLGELKGVAMKVAQMMSYIDVALPEEIRNALSVLQTHSQPMSFDTVGKILRSELGSCADALIDRMDPVPIAAASIGQVHTSSLPNGTRVAVKIRYPKIEKAIAGDFGPAAFGSRIASFFYSNTRAETFLDEARTRFLEECDYMREASYQQEFSELFVEHPVIAVPEVHHPYGGTEVLTTTHFEGLSFEEFLASNPSQEVRDQIGEALFEFYVGSLFKFDIYNCDPHPGNYSFLPDGRVAVFDHGCAQRLKPFMVQSLALLSRAVHADDRALLHRALVDLGIVTDGKAYDYAVARELMRSLYGVMLQDEKLGFDRSSSAKMRVTIRSKRQLGRLRLPGEFLFLFRVRIGLMAVLARLGARANWYQLERSYIEGAIPTSAAVTPVDETAEIQESVASVQPSFDVVLVGYSEQKIPLIREIRDLTGVGLKEARDLVDGSPAKIGTTLDRKRAEGLQERLSAVGGQVEIRPAS